MDQTHRILVSVNSKESSFMLRNTNNRFRAWKISVEENIDKAHDGAMLATNK